MSLFHNSKHKLRNAYRTIDTILDGDFPISSGKSALAKLRKVFEGQEEKLDRAHKLGDSAALQQIARIISVKIYQALPILGFILRSTNVRNAFEVLEPLQHLADAVLQGRPQLLLSSEWDYVPFAYPQSLEDLRSFVLIGLPASEASSALLLPLAGHELGHAVWKNRGIEGSMHATLQTRCEDLFNKDMAEFKKQFPDYDSDDMIRKEILPEAIADTVGYAVLQAEELFCDLFAYAIFGASYLFAFAYIVAPGLGRSRSPDYPSNATRISTLKDVASKEGIALPDLSAFEFAEENLRADGRSRYLIRKAEDAVKEVIQEMWGHVSKIIQDGNIPRPNSTHSTRHLTEFRLGIPAHQPQCLGDVTVAGWTYFQEIQSITSKEQYEKKSDYLNEMMLKTIEVLEFSRRTQDGSKLKTSKS